MFRLPLVARVPGLTLTSSLVKRTSPLFSTFFQHTTADEHKHSLHVLFHQTIQPNNTSIMCFGRRSSASAYASSSSSSDEYNARPIELSTLRRATGGTGRSTASMPQAAQRTSERETIRIVEEARITCDDQHKQCKLCHLRSMGSQLTSARSQEVSALLSSSPRACISFRCLLWRTILLFLLVSGVNVLYSSSG